MKQVEIEIQIERERGGREEIAKVRMSFVKSLRLRLRFLLA